MDIEGILSGEVPISVEISLDTLSVTYLAGALLAVGILLIIIGKKVIK
jgi:hypothetical protein